MATILLKLAAPLQSWGVESKFNKRMTQREPTKSGVIGMVAAALGRSRDDSIDDLRGLTFAVRVDQPGEMVKDFHTAHTFDGKTAFISDRYYLSDAVFVAALEGESQIIANVATALKNPVYPLFLGRRACPPAGQIALGISEKSAVEALLDVSNTAKWQAAKWYMKKQPRTVHLRIVRDADFSEPGAFEARDMPVTFSQEYRKYTYRSMIPNMETATVDNEFAPLSSLKHQSSAPDSKGAQAQASTSHDAFNVLEK
ncbi:MAG: type I-E CRISPR-associated protein Cas5/CasD [Clostridiales Family XIII bacterium]|jgi:CRISPR system Cascade subunit CasD|nr:type I-E CRISPR-associated protein Cas5/CasD [Clostridiales Family XIII bacterium]